MGFRKCPPLIAVMLCACQSVAAPAPVTQPPQAAPARPLAPTVAPLPLTTTAVPATATPAVSPSPIPTADFAPQAVFGTWFRSDRDRGDLYLILTEQGGYIASHGTPEGVVHTGDYALEGRLFKFLAPGWGEECDEGIYTLRLASEGKWLFFDLLEDRGCLDRIDSIGGKRWLKVEPGT